MDAKRWKASSATALAVLALVSSFFIGVQPAAAATVTINVTFGDWRCSATGGGTVTSVQMGSQYGSSPRTSGRTIRIAAKTNASNNLTGVVWCKRPWYRGGITTPVYNVNQGLWVTRNGQSFNA